MYYCNVYICTKQLKIQLEDVIGTHHTIHKCTLLYIPLYICTLICRLCTHFWLEFNKHIYPTQWHIDPVVLYSFVYTSTAIIEGFIGLDWYRYVYIYIERERYRGVCVYNINLRSLYMTLCSIYIIYIFLKYFRILYFENSFFLFIILILLQKLHTVYRADYVG